MSCQPGRLGLLALTRYRQYSGSKSFRMYANNSLAFGNDIRYRVARVVTTYGHSGTGPGKAVAHVSVHDRLAPNTYTLGLGGPQAIYRPGWNPFEQGEQVHQR